MKLDMKEDLLILFLNKFFLSSLDINDKEKTTKFLKKIVNKLKNKYDLVFDGYYNMNLYVDINYGLIIEIKKEDLEYLDYFTSQFEMNIKVIEDSFLYEIDDIEESIIPLFDIYHVCDKIYLKAKEDISQIYLGKLLEYGKIIYGSKAKKILLKARKIG